MKYQIPTWQEEGRFSRGRTGSPGFLTTEDWAKVKTRFKITKYDVINNPCNKFTESEMVEWINQNNFKFKVFMVYPVSIDDSVWGCTCFRFKNIEAALLYRLKFGSVL